MVYGYDFGPDLHVAFWTGENLSFYLLEIISHYYLQLELLPSPFYRTKKKTTFYFIEYREE